MASVRQPCEGSRNFIENGCSGLLLGEGEGGQEVYTSQHSNVFSLGSRRQNFGRESFLAFCSEFERHTLKDLLSRTLAHVKYVLSMVHKIVASFVEKVAFYFSYSGHKLTTGTNLTMVLCAQGKKIKLV